MSVRALGGVLASPVLERELRAGMRERRMAIIQGAFVLLLGAITLFVVANSINTAGRHPTLNPGAGQVIFVASFVVQWLLVVLVAPSLTCGLLSAEREKQTYEMLVASLLSPAQIVAGKLLYALAYLAFLLISSLPVTATVFFLGGVSPSDVLLTYAAVFATGCLACLIGLFFSSRERRTTTATLQSYGVTFLLVITGGPVLSAGLAQGFGPLGQPVTPAQILSASFAWQGVSLPYVLLPLVTLAWLCAFLFVKSMNFVQRSAGHVLWIHRLFVYWALATTFLVTTGLGAAWGGSAPGEDVGPFLAILAMAALFFQGLLANDPGFSTQRDRTRYRRALSAQPGFFPLFLLAVQGLAAVLLWGNGALLRPLLWSLLVSGSLAAALYTGALAVRRLLRERVPFPAIYFALFSAALLSPLPYVLDASHPAAASFWSFYFASPYMAIPSLWTPQPTVVLAGASMSLAAAAVAFYATLAVLGAAMAWLLRSQLGPQAERSGAGTSREASDKTRVRSARPPLPEPPA